MTQQVLYVAMGCKTDDGRDGDYLFDRAAGVTKPVSPVFPGGVDLFDWCRANGWKAIPGGGLQGGYVQAAEFAAAATDPIRERARQWRELGEKVRMAMPRLASLMRPSRSDFKAAAGAVGLSLADAQRAWNFAVGAIEVPKKDRPALNG